MSRASMEASALTSASRVALLGRRGPLLRLQSDERLVDSIRDGHDGAFEVLIGRYRTRLLAYCQHILASREDAEDVLQEVFTSAHAAMLADAREINARPWLYRIARNRCLNHLRKPVADGQDSMDTLPHANGATTAELAEEREDLREVVADVRRLPETQRTALVLREIDDLSYDEIAVTMETTVSAVKSLLVRARMGLAEASEARILSCDDVRLQLAEAAEGLRKVSAPARHHLRDCPDCRRYRQGLRTSTKALAALAPIGLLGLLRDVVIAKLGGGGAASSAGSGGAAAGGGGGCAAGGGAVASGGAAAGAGSAAAGTGIAAAGSGMAAGAGGAIGSAGAFAGGAAAGGLGGVLGGKAAAGVATAALLTAGAAGVAERIGIPEGRSDSAAKTSAPAHEKGAATAGAEGATAGAEEGAPDGAAGEQVTVAPQVAAPAAAPKGGKRGRHDGKNSAGKGDENPMSGGGSDQPPPVAGGGDPAPPPPPPAEEPPPPAEEPPPPEPAA